ncbi:uncharacterized protein zgc:193711 [Trichomycterus rosablanca]|uniref:uncharacterized protein zgc:193711 n=1 Tax=Trichomycterus rosablanca TaxID=2290929 RepID=UPI002F35555D
MGNRLNKTLQKWGLNTRKPEGKRSTNKAPHAASSYKAKDVRIYDHVASEPQYARVNKRKKTDTDNLHYAEIQVLQSEAISKQKPVEHHDSTTEYATIDFLRSFKPDASSKPADILIPPGELQRPKGKSQSVKSASLNQAVIV